MQWKKLDILITVIAIVMALYHLISTQYLFFSSTEHSNIHLGFSFLLVFLPMFRMKKRVWPIASAILVLALVVTGYIQIFYEELVGKPEFLLTKWEVILGFILIGLVLEGSRREFGPIFLILGGLSLLYVFFGHYLPEPFHVMGLPVVTTIAKLGMGLHSGIYGTALSVSAEYIFLFLIFGAILKVSGGTDFFIQLGRLLGGRMKGGPGLTSVIASCLMGMITGAVTVNVATIGTFTIPLMKKVGYKPIQAAAIETAASCGGQIMPPVMGITAFLMVGFTGISYLNIMIAAAIPALLYFFSIALYVQFQAMKLNISPIVEEVDFKKLFLSAPMFVIPLFLLVYLLIRRYSVFYSIFWSIVTLVGLSLLIGIFKKENRSSFKEWMENLVQGATMGAQIAMVCACVGIVVALFEVWGLGFKFTNIIQLSSGGIPFIALIECAIIVIFLGLGLPTAPTYILTVLTVVPTLVEMKFPLLAIHLFVFYFGVIAFATPPEAMGALIASRIAGSDFMKTGWESMKVASGGFIIPFLFIMSPSLIYQANNFLEIVISVIAAIAILIAIQITICNYYLVPLHRMERLIYLIVVVIIIIYFATNIFSLFIVGISFLFLLTYWQWMKRRALSSH